MHSYGMARGIFQTNAAENLPATAVLLTFGAHTASRKLSLFQVF